MTGRGGGSTESAPMRDVYNFIVVDHLNLAIGTGGFLLGWLTGRRRKPNPARVEAYDYYGLD
jgi:hypothetical protein